MWCSITASRSWNCRWGGILWFVWTVCVGPWQSWIPIYCNACYGGTSFLELCVNSRSTTTLQEGGIMWRVISCGIWHQCCDVCYMGTLFLEFAQSHAYIPGISYEHCKLSHGIHAAIYATWGHCSWCSWRQFALLHGTLLWCILQTCSWLFRVSTLTCHKASMLQFILHEDTVLGVPRWQFVPLHSTYPMTHTTWGHCSWCSLWAL